MFTIGKAGERGHEDHGWLQEWMEDNAIWRVVERLAAALPAEGTVQGETLRQVLSPLTEGHEACSEPQPAAAAGLQATEDLLDA